MITSSTRSAECPLGLEEIEKYLLEQGAEKSLLSAFRVAIENNVIMEFQAAGVFQSK